MRLGRLSRSFALRLTILYLGLFAGSSVLLLGAAWWFSVHAPMQQVKGIVARESEALLALHDEAGLGPLVAALDRREVEPGPWMPFHALIAANGRVLTANLPSWPAQPTQGWHRFEADLYVNGDEYDHEALVLDQRLSDGSRLIVGRDIERLGDREDWIESIIFWSMGGIILLGLIGGLLMSRAIGRKLEEVSRAARTVMAGDLSGRVETSGSGDDFDALGNTLNAMLSRIEDLIESIGRISDNIAHELRTPLARLKMSLEEAAEDNQRIEGALAEADRLEAIFDALLRIARVERGRQVLRRAPVDIAAILADAAGYYEPEADAKDQRLIVDVEDDVRIDGDRDLLFQAVANLLDNAVKYAPPGARILLRSRRVEGATLIEVCDNGGGVDPAYVARLTERFYRAPTSGGLPGIGLGLSLVEAIARAHQAELRLDSRPSGLCARLIFGGAVADIEGMSASAETVSE